MAEADPGLGDSTAFADRSRLESWVDHARGEAAAARRRREHWLRQQSVDDTSLVGILVDHAEQGSTVAVATCTGGRYHGQVRGAGAHLFLLDTATRQVAIAVAAIDTVAVVAGDGPRRLDPVGHRTSADPTTMAEVLALAVGERPEVTLVTRSGAQVAGELVAVGRDVAMVRPPNRLPLVYAPLASVSEALLPASTGSG